MSKINAQPIFMEIQFNSATSLLHRDSVTSRWERVYTAFLSPMDCLRPKKPFWDCVHLQSGNSVMFHIEDVPQTSLVPVLVPVVTQVQQISIGKVTLDQPQNPHLQFCGTLSQTDRKNRICFHKSGSGMWLAFVQILI